MWKGFAGPVYVTRLGDTLKREVYKINRIDFIDLKGQRPKGNQTCSMIS